MKKRTVAVVMAAAMTIGMMVTGVSVQAGVEDKTLIVGFDAEYPPFGYKDDNGEYVDLTLTWLRKYVIILAGSLSRSRSTGIPRIWS